MTREFGGVPRKHFAVPASLAGERIDRAVALLTGWSRADVAVLVEAGAVRIGGEPVAKSRRLAEGEEVEVEGAPDADSPPWPAPTWSIRLPCMIRSSTTCWPIGMAG